MSFPWPKLGEQVSRLLLRGDSEYDEARKALTWNQRLATARAPEAIAYARSVQEVAAAVNFSRRHSLRISPRGSGHSYDAAALHEAGIMLDLSGIDTVEIDLASSAAWVGAGIRGGNLLDKLAEHDLAFPAGHCPDVAISGYILSGGFGWNSGDWGPASANVSAIEMVLASGETIVATEQDHSDLFWAARGAGAGFFAVVTRYRLNLLPLPPVAYAWTASFAAEDAAEVAPWLTQVTDAAANTAEITCLVGPEKETGVPAITIHASATGETEQDAREKLASFRSAMPNVQVISAPKEELLEFTELTKLSAMPSGKRAACDHCWFDASIGDALLAVHHLAGVPAKASSINLFMFGGEDKVAKKPDGKRSALSLGGGNGAGIYALWDDPAEDELHLNWVRDVDAALSRYRTGRYVGEAALAAPNRYAECFTPEVLERLEGLRRHHDPAEMFSSLP